MQEADCDSALCCFAGTPYETEECVRLVKQGVVHIRSKAEVYETVCMNSEAYVLHEHRSLCYRCRMTKWQQGMGPVGPG